MFIAEFSNSHFTEHQQLALTTVPGNSYSSISLPLPLNFCFSKSVTLFSPGMPHQKNCQKEEKRKKKGWKEGTKENLKEKEEKPNQRTLYA